MYEYERNPINNNPDYLNRLDIIEDFSADFDCLKKINMQTLFEDNINSPIIEGNHLTKTEAMYFLENDVTVHGRSLRDFLQISNQRRVNTDILQRMIENNGQIDLSTGTILEIHRSVTYGELPYQECGVFRDNIVTLATTIKIPPDWNDVPKLIEQLIREYQKPLDIGETQFERICEWKRNFELIHPFFDGNGRTGRIIMNALFIQNGYPVITIPYEKRLDYFDSLENNTFCEFCSELMIDAIKRVYDLEKKEGVIYENGIIREGYADKEER